MKKSLIIIALLIGGFFMLSSFNNQYSFCDGWDEGYQEALDGCLRIGVTPICPIPPVGKDTYRHGYGMGYSKGEQFCNN